MATRVCIKDIEDLAAPAGGRRQPCTQQCTNCPTRESPKIWDIIIVGCGAIGCSIARELAKYQLSVLMLEKASDIAQGASKANSGIVHGGYDEEHGTLKSKVSHWGNQLFSGLDEELEFGFRRIGSLVLAFSQQERDGELVRLLQNGARNGVQGLRILDGYDEICKIEPHVHPSVVAALHCPHTGITSPYEYVIALAENAMENGVEIKLLREVVGIEALSLQEASPGNLQRQHHHGHQAGGEEPACSAPAPQQQLFRIRAENHSTLDYEVFHSRVVINCAGLYADKIAQMVGPCDFQIVPRLGEYILLDKSQGHLAQHVLFPVPSLERGKGILVSPTFWGNLLLGPTSRTLKESFEETNTHVLHFIIKSAQQSLPAFDVSHAITSYTGLRAKCSRKDFVIEENPAVKNFINVAGIDSPGLTSSPAIALVVCQLLQSKTQLAFRAKDSFQPRRRRLIQPKQPNGPYRVDHPDPRFNIICRCEGITEAEILDTMSRPSPVQAHSTDTIKRRTRAGMGACQGRFCEPRVSALISRETGQPLEKVERRALGSSILPHQRLTEDDKDLLDKMQKLEYDQDDRQGKLLSKL
ncbi:glycerol-3-phosphate dehydrogenase [Polychytrium aggregatum]|uniref:glycerol-3-phosphate dehydrogenase n=1 Tax=Polychytrium aggregatum TaxID=110093 RepID=UPI0022FE8AFB|nr:glycerol-3-phosphate dehydrogenase [Polychytrium aggregatum]KAI9208686.1 glycerol-3-phosphate dehydrogenase [Polychytrium aggregatum]